MNTLSKRSARSIPFVLLVSVPLLALTWALAGSESKSVTIEKDGQPLFNQPVAYLGIKAKLTKGQTLKVVANKGRWLQVQGDAIDGWIVGAEERKIGGEPVDAKYLGSTETASIGAGLVTKGFSDGYATQHGAKKEDLPKLHESLTKDRFNSGEFDAFAKEGGLTLAWALDLQPVGTLAVQAPEKPKLPDMPEDGDDEGSADEDGAGEDEGADEDDTDDLVDDLDGAKKRLKERGKLMSDPLYFSNNLSLEAEQEMGLAVSQRLAAPGLIQDEMLIQYISLIGAALVEQCDRSDIPYRFSILDSPQINAFAAPGGFIFVTSGCILACQSEAELAGVLAHEVAHIARRHGLRQLDLSRDKIAKKMAEAELDRTLDKYYGPMDEETASLVRKLGAVADDHYRFCTASRGQEFELEADAFGLRYLAAVGWDVRGLTRFLQTLRKGEGITLGEAWSSHPPAAERLAHCLAIIATDGLKPNENFRAERFMKFRGRLAK